MINFKNYPAFLKFFVRGLLVGNPNRKFNDIFMDYILLRLNF